MAEPRQWNILLVEDEEDIRDVMTMILEDAGHRVISAENGEAGLLSCRQHRPEIVITDIRMPKLDGIEMLARIKKELPDTEVIVVTAYGEMDLAVRALQLDASDFLTKPVYNDAIQLAVERAGDRYAARKDLKDYAALLELKMEVQVRSLHQDKMMAMGRLAASVVHEINNPLSGILNYIRLMGRVAGRGPMEEEQRKKFVGYLDLVEKETERCSRIVSGLLDFSRKSPPDFGLVNLSDLIDRTLSLTSHKLELKNIRIETNISQGLPSVRGDFNQLLQCVINLVFNGMDAMEAGGLLTITVANFPEKKHAKILVSDTGSGIPSVELERIFEPFYTTKKEGAGVGLGLSTVFGIMQRHGGDVIVEETSKSGTIFALQLPTGG